MEAATETRCIYLSRNSRCLRNEIVQSSELYIPLSETQTLLNCQHFVSILVLLQVLFLRIYFPGDTFFVKSLQICLVKLYIKL